MYRRPKFLEVLLDIRKEMARAADYDVDLFTELVRTGGPAKSRKRHSIAVSENDGPKVPPVLAVKNSRRQAKKP
jgi:hypothetical protein